MSQARFTSNPDGNIEITLTFFLIFLKGALGHHLQALSRTLVSS